MISYSTDALAVVEDVNDPLGMGRVKARIIGLHTQDTQRGIMSGISTDDLPWVQVEMPVTSSSSMGVGQSPTGLQVGDRVGVRIRDEFAQDYTVKYSLYGKTDVYNLAQGGYVGGTADKIIEENRNRKYSQAPLLKPSDKIKEDNSVVEDDFVAMIEYDEGVRFEVYKDSLGFPTIGIGHLLVRDSNVSIANAWGYVERDLGYSTGTRRRLTNDEVNSLFKNDVRKLRSSIGRYPLLASAYASVGKARQYALENMCFQMGVAGTANFQNSLGMILAEEWEEVYRNLLKSRWASQTPSRATRVALALRNGNLYHYPIPSNAGKRPPDENKGDLEGKTRSFKKSSFFPDIPEIGGESSGFDFTSMQGSLHDSFYMLLNIRSISNISDIKNIIHLFGNTQEIIDELKRNFDEFKDKINEYKDIEVADYYRKYLNKIERKIESLAETVRKFIESTSRQIDDFDILESLGKTVEFLGKSLSYKIDSMRADINNKFIEISESLHLDEDFNDSGVAFSEPYTEYSGEYPNVQTQVSKSGHMIMLDDTPDSEMMEIRHRSGTTDIYNPSGTKVQKIIGDGYTIIERNGYIDISGTLALNVSGTANIQILGNVNQVIEGDVIQRIRGDVDQDIAGNMESVVHGNSKSLIHGLSEATINKGSKIHVKMDGELLIEGDTIRTYKGDVTDIIEGSYTSTVKGDSTTITEGTRNDSAEGEWNRKGSTIRDESSGQHTILGSEIHLNGG